MATANETSLFQEVVSANEIISQAVVDKDYNAIQNAYTESSLLLGYNALPVSNGLGNVPVIGNFAIRLFFQAAQAAGAQSLDINTKRVTPLGDGATECGTSTTTYEWYVLGTQHTKEVTRDYHVEWERGTDGKLRVAYDRIFSGNSDESFCNEY